VSDLFLKLNNVDKIQELWDGFHNLYEVLKKNKISSNKAKKFGDDTKKWVKKFCIYQSKMSLLIFIFSLNMLENFFYYTKNINQFTYQGMEKSND